MLSIWTEILVLLLINFVFLGKSLPFFSFLPFVSFCCNCLFFSGVVTIYCLE